MTDGREGGYIKLYRAIESSEDFVGLRPDQAWVAVRILQLANFKPGFMRFRSTAVPVGRGEVGHTIETIAKRSGATRKVVRTTLSHLMQTGFLGTRTGTVAGTAYRILIVRNYERFQGEDEESGTVAGTVTGHDRATTGPRPGTKIRREEGEEGKETTLADAAAPLALVPEEAPRKRRKPASPTDPRFAPLRAAWEAAFLAERHEPYRWLGAKDARGVHALIAVELEEFAQRARRALNASGFARCSSVAQLSAKWNDLAGVGDRRTGPAPVSKSFDTPF